MEDLTIFSRMSPEKTFVIKHNKLFVYENGVPIVEGIKLEDNYSISETIQNTKLCKEHLIIDKFTNNFHYSIIKITYFADCVEGKNQNEMKAFYTEYLQNNKPITVDGMFLKIILK